MRRLLQLVIPCVLLSGCFGPGEGVEVPQDQIYFPVGLALDKGVDKDGVPTIPHLFVVSSDFDLQYNGGAVQSYDLDELHRALPQLCAVDADCATGPCESGLCACPNGDRADSDRLLFPGRCQPIDPTPKALQKDTVKIGAFATDAILRQRDDSDSPEQRLFVPVRGDSTLHWLDVNGDDGTLECGQHGSADKACNAAHRAGDDPTTTPRNIKLNSEPFAVDASVHGEQIVVTNQTTGTASLFVNDWDHAPLLKFALASDRIPSRPVGIAALPSPTDGEPPPPGGATADAPATFLMTFRNSAQVRLLRFAPDGTEDTTNQSRPYLVDGNGVAIDANSVGSDSRGVAVDGSARRRAKQRCAGDADCNAAANLVPLDVYVANRAPSSLLIGRTQPPQEYPRFFQSVALTAGPSRIVIGQVTTASGEKESRVFVACFDSRRVFVYDPQRSRVETEILTGRGPYALVVDPTRQLLYVGHFTDSYVGAYSLDLAHPATYGTMLGTLGTPKSPRASK
jgi:hypothetical protein